MKIIKYKFLSCDVNEGTEENPIMKPVIFEKSMDYSEINEEIAKKEAYNGEYTIEDDGQPDPVSEQSQEERIRELEEALEMLLSGVTE